MGVFDIVFIDCPVCGNPVRFQSKSGDCTMSEYTKGRAPIEVAADVIGEDTVCPQCSTELRVQTGMETIQLWLEENE